MSYGPIAVYSVTVATGGTSSSGIDLGRAFKTMYLNIPTMTSNTEIYIQCANTLDGAYRRVMHPMNASSTPVGYDFIIPSMITNKIVPIPNGMRFIKTETSAICSFTADFKVICSD